MKKILEKEFKNFASGAQTARDKYCCTKGGSFNIVRKVIPDVLDQGIKNSLRFKIFFRLNNGVGFGIQTLDFSFYRC